MQDNVYYEKQGGANMCANNHLPPDFESIFGEVNSIEEQAPGVYYIIACEECKEHFQEYYIVANHAPFFEKISQYGENCEI